MLDTYEKLFCRRCFSYDCREHGSQQPRHRERRLPVNSLLQKDFSKYMDRLQAAMDAEEIRAKIRQEMKMEKEREKGRVPKDIPSPVAENTRDPLTPCGENCFINTEVFTKLKDDHESVDLSSLAVDSLSPMEDALLLKLALICGRNLCKVAKLMKVCTCKQVWVASVERGIIDSRLETHHSSSEANGVNAAKLERRQRKKPKRNVAAYTGPKFSFRGSRNCKLYFGHNIKAKIAHSETYW